MNKITKEKLRLAVFDSFVLSFCYGLCERTSAMFADGLFTSLELKQIVLVLLLLTTLFILNPRNYAD